MILLIVFIAGVCIYKLRDLIKRRRKKEIMVFLGITFTALLAGYIYISDPLVHKSILTVLLAVAKNVMKK